MAIDNTKKLFKLSRQVENHSNLMRTTVSKLGGVGEKDYKFIYIR